MINVTDAFKEKLEAGEPVRMMVDIIFPDGKQKTIDADIMSGDNGFTDCAESSDFPVGATICKTLTLNINNYDEQWKSYNFYGANIHAYLKMQTSYASVDEKDVIETIDKGDYTVTTPEQYSDIISITALDDMYKANKTYTSGLILPQTILNLVRDACETIGISIDVKMEHGNYIVKKIPDKITFRQLFGYAAMLEAANARIDYSGNLYFAKWDFRKTDIPDLKKYGNPPTLSSDDIIITGVRLKNSDSDSDSKSILYGKEGYVLELENGLISADQLESAANIIGSQLVGAKFRNLEGDLIYNPLVEFGDMVYSYDRLGNKYLTPLTDVSGNVGGITTVKTQAKDPIRGSSDFYTSDVKTIVAAKNIVDKETSARENAIKKLNKKLEETNASGMFCTDVKQPDESTIRYLHDKPTLEESQNIIKITATAIGISNDNGKTYPYGIILDGKTITRLLYAEGINADYINSGTLLVKDKNGNTVFEADMDTSTVRMADTVMIGDRPLKDWTDDIKKSKTVSVVLSNEYQGIPTDENGNYTAFPECKTTIQTLYGSDDVTNDAEYTVTENNVTGTWSEYNHTYTVTDLSADTGYVDFLVKHRDLSVQKRFMIVKQKQGKTGMDSVTYYIQTDSSVVIRSNADTDEPAYTPETILFTHYKKNGDNDAVKCKGYATLETSVDGSTWVVVANPSSSFYSYQFTVKDAPAGTTLIRYILYTSASKTQPVDIVTVPVINDSRITEKMIFNLLTDNGTRDLLTYVDNKLYLNGTYIKGKTIEADKLNITDLYAVAASIAQWIIKDDYIQSKNGNITLYSDGRIKIGNAVFSQNDTDTACVVKYGLHIFCKGPDSAGFSDGSGQLAISGLDSSTSGVSLVLKNRVVYKLSSSSKRYKDHVRNMTSEEAKKLLDVPVIWFKYKDGYLKRGDRFEGKAMPGFYAEDVFEQFPEGVVLNDDNQIEDWNYRTMVPAMLKLIQDQQKTIDNLIKRIEKLERE